MIKIKTILLKNLDIKLLAFAMAIVLWFYISSEYNITAERYYDIEVRPINLSGNLSIKEIRDKVSVGIQGPQNILENISSQKIVGTVDLKNIREAGEYQIITDIVVPKSTNITKIIPNEIRVTVEEIIESTFPVEYSLIGLPERGYSLEDEPEINPQEVTIAGAESLLQIIEKVKIDIDISSMNEDISREEKVSIFSKENSEIEGLKVNPETVSVLIRVGEGYPEKILPIRPRIVGKPAPEYYISKIEADPSYIRVYGNYSKIGYLNYLETIPIDVNGISKTLTVRIPPILGEGIYLADEQITLVEVQIFVEEKEEEYLFQDISIMHQDASPFVDYQLNPEMADVKVVGKSSSFKNITDKDIKLFVNLSNVESEKAKVEVELPPEIDLIQVIPEEVEITIKK